MDVDLRASSRAFGFMLKPAISTPKRPTTFCLNFTVSCVAHASQASTGSSLTGFVRQGRSANDQCHLILRNPFELFPDFDLVSSEFLQILHHCTASEVYLRQRVCSRIDRGSLQAHSGLQHFVEASVACFLCSELSEEHADRLRLEIMVLPFNEMLCVPCVAAYFRNRYGCKTAKQDLDKALAPFEETEY
jgi:hypothetical protein